MNFYAYPPGEQLSPFDPVDGGNYFAYAGSFTYLGSFEDVGNIGWPGDERSQLLLGQNVLMIFKRHSIVHHGSIIYLNGGFDDGHHIGISRFAAKKYVLITESINRYAIDTWRDRKLETYVVQNADGTFNCSLMPLLFDSPDRATAHALDGICRDTRCIVAQWFADIDRY